MRRRGDLGAVRHATVTTGGILRHNPDAAIEHAQHLHGLGDFHAISA
jgi:hypothetical protein